jgi:hypothetical protein
MTGWETKIACGASCLLNDAIRNLKNYSNNKQPEIILQ